MTGQTLIVTLLAAFGAGFCAGLLVGPIFNWWYRRRSELLRAEWHRQHGRITEAEFARLVNSGKRGTTMTTENELRDIERTRDLPPDEPATTGEVVFKDFEIHLNVIISVKGSDYEPCDFDYDEDAFRKDLTKEAESGIRHAELDIVAIDLPQIVEV